MVQLCQKGFTLEEEQRHSQLAARIAARIVGDPSAAEHAWLAALLHDVGKLVLATRMPEQFLRIVTVVSESGRPSFAVEEEMLGVSHAEVGAYLLGLWGLPFAVIEAVAHHHHPGRVSDQTEFGALGATHVADFLAREQIGNTPPLQELEMD